MQRGKQILLGESKEKDYYKGAKNDTTKEI